MEKLTFLTGLTLILARALCSRVLASALSVADTRVRVSPLGLDWFWLRSRSEFTLERSRVGAERSFVDSAGSAFEGSGFSAAPVVERCGSVLRRVSPALRVSDFASDCRALSAARSESRRASPVVALILLLSGSALLSDAARLLLASSFLLAEFSGAARSFLLLRSARLDF